MALEALVERRHEELVLGELLQIRYQMHLQRGRKDRGDCEFLRVTVHLAVPNVQPLHIFLAGADMHLPLQPNARRVHGLRVDQIHNLRGIQRRMMMG